MLHHTSNTVNYGIIYIHKKAPDVRGYSFHGARGISLEEIYSGFANPKLR